MTPRNHIRPRPSRPWSVSGLLVGGVGLLLLGAASVTAQDATDIVTLDLRPHHDHVHAGSLVQVTDRDGYDNQPYFVDHDRILFSSIRDGEQADVFRYTISQARLERLTETPESEYSPKLTPEGDAFTVVRVEMDGVSQHLYRYSLEGDSPERLLPEVDDIGYYAWAGPHRVALFRVGDPSSLHLADLSTGELHHVQDRIGPVLQSIPGTDAVSFVDQSDPERPVLKRLDGASGEVTTVAELPSGALEHVWMSDATVLMGHEGTLYRSTRDPERPWHPLKGLDEVVGPFDRLALAPSGFRLAVVTQR